MKSSIFTRMVLALLLLLTPIIALYAYSNHTSSSVLTREIVKAKRTQVETFVGQLGQMFAQYDSYQKMLYESTEVRNLAYPDLLNDDLLYYRTLKTVSEEISRLAGYGRWKGIIAVVYPKTGVVIKSNSSLGAVPAELPDKDGFWSYRTSSKGNAYFIETISNPAKSAREEEADLTVVAKVDEGEIKSDLSEMKSNGLEDPFLYKPGDTPIYNYTANQALIQEMLPELDPAGADGEFEPLLIRTSGGTYQVHMDMVQSLGWYLVDYVPIDTIMAPIKRSQTMFYSISGMMLFMACILSFLLYRSIRIPFRKLMQGMNFIEKGIYTSRMKDPPKGEFRYVYQKFNSMAARIEELIEDVLKEQIRTKEANVKQLQSQINPHFLYNTLAYIKSMVELEEKEAAVSMTMNLSRYYRYTTKLSSSFATIQEELNLIENYLDIHRMLTDDFEYEIDIDPAMLKMEIPRLSLQPLIENVIVHAFRKPVKYGSVRIRGTLEEGGLARLTVDDNGTGMTPAQLESLRTKIRTAPSDQIDSGLQNVHQRLMLLFGKSSGLFLSHSERGGLCAELVWQVQVGEPE
ncbi:two-component system, sensor histidine kinase YesM [Cohnella sp. OV330]|uniref:sensor histidine kinase n=1 Tax=Cohnella sp. OV330 TaxID=1855288 RepID=UPI0008EF5EFD|nr:sensor histidine kinase [Cohnella sp. OV330]SFB04025.1 two-component system, sensor histidine kinase YesM [Cohnella sp. OV330]